MPIELLNPRSLIFGIRIHRLTFHVKSGHYRDVVLWAGSVPLR